MSFWTKLRDLFKKQPKSEPQPKPVEPQQPSPLPVAQPPVASTPIAPPVSVEPPKMVPAYREVEPGIKQSILDGSYWVDDKLGFRKALSLENARDVLKRDSNELTWQDRNDAEAKALNRPIPPSEVDHDLAMYLVWASMKPGCTSIVYQLVQGTDQQLGTIINSVPEASIDPSAGYMPQYYLGKWKATVDAYVSQHAVK